MSGGEWPDWKNPDCQMSEIVSGSLASLPQVRDESACLEPLPKQGISEKEKKEPRWNFPGKTRCNMMEV